MYASYSFPKFLLEKKDRSISMPKLNNYALIVFFVIKIFILFYLRLKKQTNIEHEEIGLLTQRSIMCLSKINKNVKRKSDLSHKCRSITKSDSLTRVYNES